MNKRQNAVEDKTSAFFLLDYITTSLYAYLMSNKILSTEALQLVANRFKILSEPIRLRILQTLQDCEKSVTELTKMVDSSQPNVSKHLKILQDAGIVKRYQQGNTVYYSIADDSIFTLCEVVCNSIEFDLKSKANFFSLNSVDNK